MHSHWLRLVSDNDLRVDTFLGRQIAEGPDRGSHVLEFGYPDPKPTLFLGVAAVAAFFCPESRYHGCPEIVSAYDAALGYAERRQNPDGTFDYGPCNFQSAPDTSFIVHRLVLSYDLIVGHPGSDFDRLGPSLRGLLGRAGHGMASGGFHTPNHRWALAAALSSVARITGSSWFDTQANLYLREGIDGNVDGEYAERSSGIYNQVTNEQMLTLFHERHDPLYLGFVDRNLELMLTFIEPDQSIFTQNSTRQDRGTKVWLDLYYPTYLAAFQVLNKPLYASVARQILEDVIASGRKAPDCLDLVMVRWGGLEYGDELPPIPTDYAKLYPGSGIARVRRGPLSLSLVRDSPRFLYLQSGAITASLQLGAVFFQYRDFRAQTLTREGDAWVLTMDAQGWYYRPFDQAPESSDWWAMDHTQRPRIDGPRLRFEVRVTDRTDGFDVAVSVQGWAGVPLRFDVALSPGTFIEGSGFALEGRAPGVVVVKEGMVRVRSGLDTLEVGPGFADHLGVASLYGGEALRPDSFTLCFTGFTPFERTLSWFRTSELRPGKGSANHQKASEGSES